ncbi:MAG: ribulose bisphosphate carboxylase small subunit, partial [Myxococcales bacterium]
MRVTQGTFSFLPDLTDDQIRRQVGYALGRGWAVSVEHTDDPHPRNVYWELWGAPMFDLCDPAPILQEVKACRAAHPDRYVKFVALDVTRGWETVRLSFLVQRPAVEPTFELLREEGEGRRIRYTLRTRR